MTFRFLGKISANNQYYYCLLSLKLIKPQQRKLSLYGQAKFSSERKYWRYLLHLTRTIFHLFVCSQVTSISQSHQSTRYLRLYLFGQTTLKRSNDEDSYLLWLLIDSISGKARFRSRNMIHTKAIVWLVGETCDWVTYVTNHLCGW